MILIITNMANVVDLYYENIICISIIQSNLEFCLFYFYCRNIFQQKQTLNAIAKKKLKYHTLHLKNKKKTN